MSEKKEWIISIHSFYLSMIYLSDQVPFAKLTFQASLTAVSGIDWMASAMTGDNRRNSS